MLTTQGTAHMYYPQLVLKILEVREHIDGPCHFAFLQARDPVALYSRHEAHMQPTTNTADWELVAGGRGDGRGARGRDRSVRLAALESLQEMVEKQGMLKQVWSHWEGSRVMDQSLSEGNADICSHV
jgi:hypothetical protein